MFLVTQEVVDPKAYINNEVQVLTQLAQLVADKLEAPVQSVKSDLLASEAYQASTIGGQAVLPKICSSAVAQPTIFACTLTQPVPWYSEGTWHPVTNAIILVTPKTEEATSVLDIFQNSFKNEHFTDRPTASELESPTLGLT